MKYAYIGWCKEGKHDKVYVVIELSDYNYFGKNGKILCIWGRRGGKLSSKMLTSDKSETEDLINSKKKKGYTTIFSENDLEKIYPEFKSDLEKVYIWNSLVS